MYWSFTWNKRILENRKYLRARNVHVFFAKFAMFMKISYHKTVYFKIHKNVLLPNSRIFPVYDFFSLFYCNEAFRVGPKLQNVGPIWQAWLFHDHWCIQFYAGNTSTCCSISTDDSCILFMIILGSHSHPMRRLAFFSNLLNLYTITWGSERLQLISRVFKWWVSPWVIKNWRYY